MSTTEPKRGSSWDGSDASSRARTSSTSSPILAQLIEKVLLPAQSLVRVNGHRREGSQDTTSSIYSTPALPSSSSRTPPSANSSPESRTSSSFSPSTAPTSPYCSPSSRTPPSLSTGHTLHRHSGYYSSSEHSSHSTYHCPDNILTTTTTTTTKDSPSTGLSTASHHHPYYFMSNSIVETTQEEEITCPVCLEPLSFRLAGEKPHVVPTCGHRLHEACFEAVYGGVSRARMRGGSLGLCGVCRGDMRLGEDGGEGPARKNKFAALSGIPQPSAGDSHKMRSISQRTLDVHDVGSLHNPTEDDDLVRLPGPAPTLSSSRSLDRIRGSTSTNSTGSTVTGRRGSADTMKAGSSAGSAHSSYGGPVWDIVKPIVTIRAEHPTIARTLDHDKKQQITCMVTIEMPSRWHAGPHPAPPLAATQELPEPQESFGTRPVPARSASGPPSTRSVDAGSSHNGSHRPTSPTPSSVYSAYAFGSTTAPAHDSMAEIPFASIVADLQNRMADWKGHSPNEFGVLKLYDYIHVRKERNVREFLVYHFEEAILCVTDDKRKGLAGKIVDGISGGSEKLRLKGRVYIRHIRTVFESSKDGELSLTIVMSDDNLDEFIMTFKDRLNLDVWKAQIESLVAIHSAPASVPPPPAPSAGMSRNGRGIVSSTSQDSVGSDYSSDASSRQTHSSAFSGYTRTTSSSTGPLSSSVIHEEDSKSFHQYDHSREGYGSPGSMGSLGSFAYSSLGSPSGAPLRDFTPLDLMLILSVPSTGATSLKLGIIKNALEFVIQNVGPRTRLSIVTFSAGEGIRGVLRKTPFIAVGKPDGRRRLETVIEELGSESTDGIGMIEHKEERINVVTAVNLALDIVLQRKVKSALTGMLLMNDGKDGAQKQQMDLVMARAEAANVPIHAIGWGRSHDPSSLWLLSNHTSGTYTFCREFYDLRDTIAGCIGGMLSVAATNVKLHISVPERRWFRIRKVSGTQAAIVSSEGKDVDIEIGELRFGERKDLLVEVEMSLGGYGGDPFNQGAVERRDPPAFSTATDAFFLSRVGLNPSALDEFQQANFFEDEYDGMPDEVPLFEVNAAFRDPAAGKSISRLNNSPCLLTITVTPPPPPGGRAPTPPSAPEIVRRRMELLSSDMLGKHLLLKGRRNDAQAQRLLEETKRIISTIMASLATPPAHSVRNGRRSSQQSAQAQAHSTLLACFEDVSTILDGSSEADQFESTFRNFAAQQAVVLREQKSWTPRSPIERLFWQSDNTLYLYQRSQNWVSARAE